MELKILAIDTSNYPMSIALVEDDRLMAQTTLNMVRNHSVYVLPTIERLMDDLGWTPADLNRVVVANGPGSYTGIRIATTTAKVLATTLGIDLVAESSLKVLATNVLPDDKRLIVPFFDARRGNVFAGGYQYQAGKLVAVMEDQHCAFSDLMVRVTQQPQGVLLIGQSTPKLADELAEARKTIVGLETIPENNVVNFARLYKAYKSYVGENHIGALCRVPNSLEIPVSSVRGR